MTQQPKTEWPDWLTALKRDMPCGCNGAYGRCTENNYATGWNDCIDHLAQRGLIVPDGWVAVPREPSVDMVDTAVNHALAIKLGGSETWRTYMTSVYKAMLAAAPKMDGK